MFDRQHPDARLPGLDGLRGLAILLVFCAHLSVHFAPAVFLPYEIIQRLAFFGWTGVDLFFVLSGFLITGILWESRAAPHYFRNFYARRTLRLFPLYYGVLILMFFILPAFLPWLPHSGPLGWWRGKISEFKDLSAYWVWYFTYSVDFLVAWQGWVLPSHFWSLAVEEHFYLVWPLLVHRLRLSTLISISWIVILFAFVLRWCLIAFVREEALYVLTPSRMDDIALGALIALTFRAPGGIESLRSVAKTAFPILVACCAAMMIAMGWTGFGSFFGPDYTTWCQYGYISQTIGYSLTGALYGSLLVLVLTHRPWARFFSNPLLRFFGKYSYALYVFHIFVFFYVAEFFALGDPSRFSILRHMSIQGVVLFDQDQSFALILDGICYLLLAVGISVALALISWRLVELPFLRMKKAFPQGTHRADGPDLITSLTHGAGANLQSGKLGVESLPGS